MFSSSTTNTVDKLTKSVTNVATETVIKNTTVSSGSLGQKQKVVFSGIVSNMDVKQEGTIKLSVLKNYTTNSKTRKELVNNITNDIKTKSKIIPTLSLFSSESNRTILRNIVEKNVNNKFNQENMENIDLNGILEQEIIVEQTAIVTDVRVNQLGKAVGELVSTMSIDIVDDVMQTAAILDNSDTGTELAGITDKVSNMAGNIIGAMGGMLSGGRGEEPTPEEGNSNNILIYLFILIVVVGIIYYFMTNNNQMIPRKMGNFANRITTPLVNRFNQFRSPQSPAMQRPQFRSPQPQLMPPVVQQPFQAVQPSQVVSPMSNDFSNISQLR